MLHHSFNLSMSSSRILHPSLSLLTSFFFREKRAREKIMCVRNRKCSEIEFCLPIYLVPRLFLTDQNCVPITFRSHGVFCYEDSGMHSEVYRLYDASKPAVQAASRRLTELDLCEPSVCLIRPGSSRATFPWCFPKENNILHHPFNLSINVWKISHPSLQLSIGSFLLRIKRACEKQCLTETEHVLKSGFPITWSHDRLFYVSRSFLILCFATVAPPKKHNMLHHSFNL